MRRQLILDWLKPRGAENGEVAEKPSRAGRPISAGVVVVRGAEGPAVGSMMIFCVSGIRYCRLSSKQCFPCWLELGIDSWTYGMRLGVDGEGGP